jgi:hypothetical protein
LWEESIASHYVRTLSPLASVPEAGFSAIPQIISDHWTLPEIAVVGFG